MQPLAVSLTLEEYRQSLMGSAGDRQAQQQAYEPSAAAAAAGSGSSFLLSHSSLSSADLEAMRLCADCRYPCYLRCAWAGCRRPPSQPAVGWGQQQAADWGGRCMCLALCHQPCPQPPARVACPPAAPCLLLSQPAHPACYLPARLPAAACPPARLGPTCGCGMPTPTSSHAALTPRPACAWRAWRVSAAAEWHRNWGRVAGDRGSAAHVLVATAAVGREPGRALHTHRR
jgi:hypothetical protein